MFLTSTIVRLALTRCSSDSGEADSRASRLFETMTMAKRSTGRAILVECKAGQRLFDDRVLLHSCWMPSRLKLSGRKEEEKIKKEKKTSVLYWRASMTPFYGVMSILMDKKRAGRPMCSGLFYLDGALCVCVYK